jgi:hypothetical protein
MSLPQRTHTNPYYKDQSPAYSEDQTNRALHCILGLWWVAAPILIIAEHIQNEETMQKFPLG